MSGYAPIRRGLLDHMPTMGALRAGVYLWLHLSAEGAGAHAGTVYCTEREVAAGTGISAGAAHEAMAWLRANGYLARVDRGYAIQKFSRRASCSNSEQTSEQPAHSVSTRRASCSNSEQLYKERKETTTEETTSPPTPPSPKVPVSPAPPPVFAAAALAATAGELFAPTTVAATGQASRDGIPTTPAAEDPTAPAPAGPGAAHRNAAAPHRPRRRQTTEAPAGGHHAETPPTPPKTTPDPRHAAVRAAIAEAYREATGRECPWSGAEGRQLAEALAAAPSWSADDWRRCVVHRFHSANQAMAAPPRQWLATLAAYLEAPMDRFGRPRLAAALPEPKIEPSGAERFAPLPGQPAMPDDASWPTTRMRGDWLCAVAACRMVMPPDAYERDLGHARLIGVKGGGSALYVWRVGEAARQPLCEALRGIGAAVTTLEVLS